MKKLIITYLILATTIFAAETCTSYFNKFSKGLGECTKIINEETDLQFQCYNGFLNVNKDDNSMILHYTKDDVTTEMVLGKSEENNRTYCVVYEIDEYGIEESIYDEYQKLNLLQLYKSFKKSNIKQKPSESEFRERTKIFEDFPTNSEKTIRTNKKSANHKIIIDVSYEDVDNMVKEIKNKEDNKPMVAWSVLSTGERVESKPFNRFYKPYGSPYPGNTLPSNCWGDPKGQYFCDSLN